MRDVRIENARPALVDMAPPAGEGVLAINQACAVNTGCFTGDAAAFPVTITNGGSYRLTSNLVVPNTNTSGIYVSASSVSIDLNGFEIVQSACEGATTNCTSTSGTGAGITVPLTSTTYFGISVKNGAITGMGYGIYLDRQSEITNVRARWNRLVGIRVSGGSTVSGNTAYQNGLDGITACGSTVSGNSAYGNGSDGINGCAQSVVSGNSSNDNGDDGISTSDGSTVSGNTAVDNGGHGIYVQNGCIVSGNVAKGNTGYGLSLNYSSGYRDNAMLSNGLGTVSGGVALGQNVCNGDTTCP